MTRVWNSPPNTWSTKFASSATTLAKTISNKIWSTFVIWCCQNLQMKKSRLQKRQPLLPLQKMTRKRQQKPQMLQWPHLLKRERNLQPLNKMRSRLRKMSIWTGSWITFSLREFRPKTRLSTTFTLNWFDSWVIESPYHGLSILESRFSSVACWLTRLNSTRLRTRSLLFNKHRRWSNTWRLWARSSAHSLWPRIDHSMSKNSTWNSCLFMDSSTNQEELSSLL